MNIAAIQSDLVWEDPDKNRSCFSRIIDDLDSNTEMVVLPEMFTTGFSMNSIAMAEPMNGNTVEWMRITSEKNGVAIVGSLVIKEDDKFFNRLIFMKPDGTFSYYDKGHLFRMERENLYFTKGIRPLIVSWSGFNISLQICYDLRFPVWSRIRNNNFDLLIYIANWPGNRRDAWNTLLRARAMENQCYVAGINRIGEDGEGLSYSGDSVILGPKGETIASLSKCQEGIITTNLSLRNLQRFRDKFPVWKDADDFKIVNC